MWITVVAALAPNRLLVTIDEDTPFSRNAADWALTCGSEVVGASSLQVRTTPVDLIPEGWPYTAVVSHGVVLGFDRIPGGDCTVGDGSFSAPYTHDPDTVLSPSIHLNQEGFAPGRAHAAISAWVPGERLWLGDATAVRVVDEASGADVATATMALRPVTADDAYGNDYTQADTWDVELGDLPEGTYHLVWEGVGRSWSFRVADDAWDAPFYVAFRGLFHQRCGGALDPALTAWSHGACHVAPIERTSADYQDVGEDAFVALPAAALGETVDGHGGYHDAGDYDRNWGHLRIVDDLVDLYALDPAKHARDDLGIPESGNGIPDLLDEAAWGASTWSRLQLPDGGVPGCVGTTGYPDLDEMPDVDDGMFYACAADPKASYRFAGAAAKLGAALAGIDDVASADWSNRAVLAWTWAEANPRWYDTAVESGYAAAELYAATGEAAYEDAFLARSPLADPSWTLTDYDGEEWHAALYSYARTSGRERDRAIAALDARASSWVGWARGSAWRIVKHPYAPVTNGTVTTPVGSGLLIRAWAVTGNEEYLEYAAYGADVSLGANPAGLSWVTGIGDRRVADPLHTPSLADAIPEPVPGLTLYGPSYLTSGSYNTAVTLAAFEPAIDQWPLLMRYADVAYVPNMNEFTVTENVAPTVFAFGALASWTADPAETTPGGPTDDPGEPGTTSDEGSTTAKDGCGCAASPRAGGLGVLLVGWLARRRADRGRGRS